MPFPLRQLPIKQLFTLAKAAGGEKLLIGEPGGVFRDMQRRALCGLAVHQRLSASDVQPSSNELVKEVV